MAKRRKKKRQLGAFTGLKQTFGIGGLAVGALALTLFFFSSKFDNWVNDPHQGQ